MFGRLGSNIWFSRFVRIVFWILVLLGLFYGLPKAVVILMGRQLDQVFGSAFGLPVLLNVFGLTLVLLSRCRLNRTNEAVLLDCGRHPRYRFIWAVSGIGIVVAFLPPLVFWSLEPLGFVHVSLLSTFAFSIVAASAKFQILRGGLWVYGRFINWSTIASYRWSGSLTVQFRVKGRFGLPEVFSLHVPSANKQAVDDLLSEYVPNGGLLSDTAVPRG